MTKKNTQVLIAIFVGCAFTVTCGYAHARNSNVEVNLEVLQGYTPPPMFDGSTSKYAPLTGVQPPEETKTETAAPIRPLLPPSKPASAAPGISAKTMAAPRPPVKPAVSQGPAPTEDTSEILVKLTPDALPPPVPPKRPEIIHATRSFVDNARKSFEGTKTIRPAATPPQKSKTIRTAQDAGAVKPAPRTYPDISSSDPLQMNLIEPSAQDILAHIDPDAARSGGGATTKESGNTPGKLTLAYQPGIVEIPDHIKKALGKPLLKALNSHEHARVEVRAFATESKEGLNDARRLSLARALEIRSFLIESDVDPRKIDIRPLGTETNTAPIDRVDILITR